MNLQRLLRRSIANRLILRSEFASRSRFSKFSSSKVAVPKRLSFLAFLLVIGSWGVSQPVYAQALIPHFVQLDDEQIRQEGLGLAQEAAQLAQFQQYGLALARAQLASQLVPDNAQVWALLGSLHLQLEEPEPAIAALLKARTLDPQNAAVFFAIGSAYFQQENYRSAIQYFQSGLRLRPNTPGARFDLGNAYYKLKQYDQAIAEYRKAIDLDAKFWPAINNMGLVLYERGDVASAVREWQRAIAIDQNQAEPQLALAVALFTQGQTDQAVQKAGIALRLDDRYADVNFLQENLWGDRLLTDAKTFFALPRVREALAQITQSASPDRPTE